MIQLLLNGQQLIAQLLVLANDAFVIFDDLIQEFIDFILVIPAQTSGKLLVMYVQRR
ncbi:hypothetical protein D3C74_468100 [compost metagenome]